MTRFVTVESRPGYVELRLVGSGKNGRGSRFELLHPLDALEVSKLLIEAAKMTLLKAEVDKEEVK